MDTPKPLHIKQLNDRLPYRLREQFMSSPELALLADFLARYQAGPNY